MTKQKKKLHNPDTTKTECKKGDYPRSAQMARYDTEGVTEFTC